MKLGLLSNELLEPWVNWSTLGPPLLSYLASKPDTKLLLPPPLGLSHLGDWRRLMSQARQMDRLFWIQPSGRPELEVHLTALARIGVRRATLVFDAFEPVLNKVGVMAVLQRLDPCFVAYREATIELRRRFPHGRFEWLPFGVDTETFAPSSGAKDIFAFWMGRRYEPLHRSLLKYCEERGLKYVFREPNVFPSPAELGAIAARSRYFVVTPANLDQPQKTGGFSPLVMRYLEGLAAGARLLGVLPGSGEYQMLLPTDAICQVAFDGHDLAEKIDQDLSTEAVWQAVEKATELVRNEHSWKMRADQIFDRLANGLPTPFEALTAQT